MYSCLTLLSNNCKIVILTQVVVLASTVHAAIQLPSWNELYATSTPQYFTSTNYPSDYNKHADESWEISTNNSNHVIRIDVIDSHTEYHKHCVYDRVSVYDGGETYSNNARIGYFCGTSSPTYISTGSKLFVWFKSDYSNQFTGFRIKYYSGLFDDIKTPADVDEEGMSIGYVVGPIIGVIMMVCVCTVCLRLGLSSYKKRGRSARPTTRLRSNVNHTFSTSDSDMQILSSTYVPPPVYSESDPRRVQISTINVQPPQYSDNNRRQNRLPPASSVGDDERQPSSPTNQTTRRHSVFEMDTSDFNSFMASMDPYRLPLSPPPPYTPTAPDLSHFQTDVSGAANMSDNAAHVTQVPSAPGNNIDNSSDTCRNAPTSTQLPT